MSKDTLLTTGQLARRCGVGPDTIRRYHREGTIKTVERVGPLGVRVFSASDAVPAVQERIRQNTRHHTANAGIRSK